MTRNRAMEERWQWRRKRRRCAWRRGSCGGGGRRRTRGTPSGASRAFPSRPPPVGPLRFKDAQPAEPWEGVRDAFKEGGICAQINMMTNEFDGSDDCLYLNVFTPQKPGAGMEPLPVMVSIHGGGFEMGSGNSDLFSYDYLIAENIIVVTFNYRLGVLGFLYLDEASPGNVGLKDQVAALRWVQKNIATFGGDPGNVTIFGISAGGASVHFQMLSPMSKGLFHRAIAMSGAALNPWAIQTEPAETTRRLARCLGCTSDDPAEIVEFLRGVDAKELVRVATTDAVPDKDRERLLAFKFVTTPEKVVPGVETFLPAPAEELMREGRHHDVPFMAGMAEKEGLFVLMRSDIRKEEMQRELDGKWEQKVLPELRRSPEGSRRAAAIEALRGFFLGGEPLSSDTLDGYVDLISDLTFAEGVMYALRCVAQKSTAPLYQYVFTADDSLNFMKILFKIDFPGATHGDDGGYLCHISGIPEVPADSTAARTRQRMVRMWANFVKTGDPTPSDDPLLGERWKPYSEAERNFLEIGAELRAGIDLRADRVAFWEHFYATYAP